MEVGTFALNLVPNMESVDDYKSQVHLTIIFDLSHFMRCLNPSLSKNGF